MATLMTAVQQRVVLTGISWETYERLLVEHDGRRSPRFIYDRGDLEIMVISFEHEELNRLLAEVFIAIAEELDKDFVDAGAVTLKREDLGRGFEPDTCFYIQNASRVRGRSQIELPTDPPPDLVIEIDITRPTIDKLPIYQEMGVSEVWRYSKEGLTIFVLDKGQYQRRTESEALPGLTADVVSQFIDDGRRESRAAWLRRVRAWARAQPG